MEPYRRKKHRLLYGDSIRIFLIAALILHGVFILIFFKDIPYMFYQHQEPITAKLRGRIDARDIIAQSPRVPLPVDPETGHIPHQVRQPKDTVFRYIDAGDMDAAQEIAGAMLEENPNNSDAYVALGEILWRTGKLHEADEHFKKAHKLNPQSTQSLHRLISNALLLDDPDAALEYHKKAAAIQKPDDMQQIMLTEIYLQRGADKKNNADETWREDVAKAKEAAEKVKDQEGAMLQIAYGKAAMLEEDRQKAIEHFEKGVDSPEIEHDYRIDILMALAVLYTETGSKEKALEKINQLVELMDEWTPASYQRGLFVREYALIYKEALLGENVDPDEIFKHQRFYRDLYRERLQRPEVELKQTLDILSEMVDIDYNEPDDVPLDEVNEYMSIAEGPRYPQCFFNKVVNRPVRYTIGYVMFGDVYFNYAEKEKAIHNYQKALELSPGNPVILEKIERMKRLK